MKSKIFGLRSLIVINVFVLLNMVFLLVTAVRVLLRDGTVNGVDMFTCIVWILFVHSVLYFFKYHIIKIDRQSIRFSSINPLKRKYQVSIKDIDMVFVERGFISSITVVTSSSEDSIKFYMPGTGLGMACDEMARLGVNVKIEKRDLLSWT